jgi:voltage-gated potassium channel
MTKWFFSVRNLIDLACFLPYYVLVSLNENSSSEFIRILRILRVFRALRMIHFVTFAKHAMVMYELVLTTFQRSAPVLVVFLFFSLLAMVFFSCLIFAFEQGKFTVNSDYPSGAYLRPTINQASKEISPYTSISASMYWAVVTGM